MVLAPHVRGEQVVERGDRHAPRDPARHLQPLGVLVEHRVDDVDERLVAVEQPVPAGQQVALQPPLAEVLGERPPSRARRARGDRRSGSRRDSHARSVASNTAPRRLEAVSSGPTTRKRSGLRRITSRSTCPQHARRLRAGCRRRRHVDGVGAEVRQLQRRAAAVPPLACGLAPMRRSPRGASAASSGRSAPLLVEQLLRAVGAQPALQLCEVLGVGGEVGERHLVGAPRALRRQAVHLLGARPALGGAQHDHRPPRALARVRAGCGVPIPIITRGTLDLRDLPHHLIERGRHQLVHLPRVVALDEARRVPVALQQRLAAPPGGSAPARWGWRSCSR